MSSQQVSVHQEHTSTVSVKSKAILFIIGIIFIAANLRAPLTSVGPLVAPIRDSLGISNTLAGHNNCSTSCLRPPFTFCTKTFAQIWNGDCSLYFINFNSSWHHVKNLTKRLDFIWRDRPTRIRNCVW